MNHLNKNHLSIIVIMTSVLLFVTSDALVKYLHDDFSSYQIVFFRSFFGLLPLLISIFYKNEKISHIPNRLELAICTLVGSFAILCIVEGIGRIPLSNFYAIQFSGPIMMTALAVPLLSESIKPSRAILILLGFVGVIIIVSPNMGGSAHEGTGSLIALLGIFLLSIFLVLIRRISRAISTLTIVLYTTLGQGLIMGFLMIPNWITPDFNDFSLLGIMGIIGTIAQMLNAKGYSLAPIQIAAPFEYSNIIWGVCIGYLFWNEVPTINVGIGAIVLLITGILLIRGVRGR